MVAISMALSAAKTLFAVLNNPVIKEVCSSMLGYKSDLEDLKTTVETIQNVLLDAAASQELTRTEQNYIEKLKTAVYDADDLFDEFRTVAERSQRLKDKHLYQNVRHFFSSDNSLKIAYQMSREIKKIREILDSIARNHTNFTVAVNSNGFAIDSKRIRNRREETCSYVNASNVIGREADVEAIVEKLLDLNGEKGAHFLTVVGIGGMGKTTLAQLVCADQRVKLEFSSKVWWVCVADENNNQFDKKAILRAILDLATRDKHHDLSLEEIQLKLSHELEGKKYLLVLDDLWNEDKVKWMELKDFLKVSAPGSRILVTSRSHNVAKAIGNSDIHVLEGLSSENSWRLFEMIAFEEYLDSQPNPLEVEIGKRIVKQCSNVPLAIKAVGSLLCGQGLDKWQTFERSGLSGIHKGGNQIMSILKLSYQNLEPSLKSCFTYCALFPKDYVIKKEMLIRHWMAHGYIVPFHEGQSIEEASEEHFLILLRRCFFQDVKMDGYGKVKSFKMHDLIHDLAKEVSGQEIMLVDTPETSNLGDKVRHVFGVTGKHEKTFYNNAKVRSYFQLQVEFPVDTLFTNGGCLRMLTLIYVGFKRLPDSIGKLLHLRYLDLSHNYHLKKLPESITKLHNLQTLKLKECIRLRELPKKFSRLVNLMHLNIENCPIRYMPPSMDKLTSLCELTHFVVADESSSGDKQVGQLKDLKAVAVNLKGRIHIVIKVDVFDSFVFDWEGSVFERAEHLQEVTIKGPADEVLLEKLLLHPNVKELQLLSYNGIKVPRWGSADYNLATILPNLVFITIADCPRLMNLPVLSKLKHLKSLALSYLHELEYIDETSYSNRCVSAVSNSQEEEEEEAECTLFPSLQSLEIQSVPKLKGWWAGVEFGDSNSKAILPNVVSITIRRCPRLKHLPVLSKLKHLKLLTLIDLVELEYIDETSCISSCASAESNSKEAAECSLFPSLESLEIKNVPKLKGLWRGVKFGYSNSIVIFSNVVSITIRGCPWLKHLPQLSKLKHLKFLTLCHLNELEYVGETSCISSCASVVSDSEEAAECSLFPSLVSLEIESVPKLQGLWRGVEFGDSNSNVILFPSLQSLRIENVPKLKGFNWEEGDDDGSAPWRHLHQNLRSLKLSCIENMTKMPKGMQYLTSLKHLDIKYCENLEEIPDWISCLSSLHSLCFWRCKKVKSIPEALKKMRSLARLEISTCSDEIKERCKEPNGEDCPKIKHIPNIVIW